MHGVTYKVGRIHDAILNRMSAIQGEFQDLLLLLPTLLLNHLLLLRRNARGFIKSSAPTYEQNASLYHTFKE